MDLTIQTNNNDRLQLQPGIPAGVVALQLPGSDVWSVEGEFGTIVLEEFKTGSFIIRSCFFKFLKKMTIQWKNGTPLTTARIAVKNKWRINVPGNEAVKLHENQFVIYYPGAGSEKMVFEKDKEYRSFDALCPPEKLKGLLGIFPGLEKFLDCSINGKSCLLVKKPSWAPPDALDIIRELPDCPFKNTLREYYLEHRLDELLFLLLALALKEEPGEQEPGEDEILAANAAEKIIMSDIRQHHSIPAIARKVHLNEFRLKYVFKYIFKTGIFEYLLLARMQEARRLLTTTDKPIKEIASLTGYQRLTSFITAFRKHFGYTPGSVRRAG